MKSDVTPNATSRDRHQVVEIALCLICVFAASDILTATRSPNRFQTPAIVNDFALIGLSVATLNRVKYARVAVGTLSLAEGAWLAATTTFTILTGRSYYFGMALVVRYLITGLLTACAGGFLLFSRARLRERTS